MQRPLETINLSGKVKKKKMTLLKSHISLSTDFRFHVWLMKNYLASDQHRTNLQKQTFKSNNQI